MLPVYNSLPYKGNKHEVQDKAGLQLNPRATEIAQCWPSILHTDI